MRKGQVKIKNQLGLHARAAAQLLRLAESFKSNIKLITLDNSYSADAKSILSVLSLAASKDTELIVQVEGTDEDIAFRAIMEIFENGFGEL
jgi:phosphotransferase system HPr (HPr) family protein